MFYPQAYGSTKREISKRFLDPLKAVNVSLHNTLSSKSWRSYKTKMYI